MEEEGKNYQGRDCLSKLKSIQHKSYFGSNSGNLAILRLQARIISTSEMNCTEVLIFTKQFGYLLNCYLKASRCGPTRCGMGVLDSIAQ